ncbi:hypothetical protein F5B19DRAFT_57848 [Rostrohypoxylon terebratum]|nr:hypothetical protein F5B19DRAFT_57848 [Rostrohypoxylon terebratum]
MLKTDQFVVRNPGAWVGGLGILLLTGFLSTEHILASQPLSIQQEADNAEVKFFASLPSKMRPISKSRVPVPRMPTAIVEMAGLHGCLADSRLPLVSQSGDMISVLPSPIQDYVSQRVISHLEIQSDRMVDWSPNVPGVRLPHTMCISVLRLSLSYFIFCHC